MKLKFIVTIEEKYVKALERQDDAVFYARLERIIRQELRGYSHVPSGTDSVHVKEIVGVE